MSGVLVIGASIIDIKGRLFAPPIANSSNSARIRTSIGGVARNIAENLARLGADVLLLTAVGDDYAGEDILSQADDIGIDVSRALIIEGEPTSTYLAALDTTGDLYLGLDDTSVMRHLTPDSLRLNRDAFRDCDVVALDLNLGDDTVGEAIRLAKEYGRTVIVDPTTTERAVRLRKHLHHLHAITPNFDEAAAILGCRAPNTPGEAVTMARQLVGLGVEVAVITQAEQGACYATANERGHFPSVEVEIADTTGAGDALTAAVIFGMLSGFSVSESVRLGLRAAALTLRTSETVSPDLSLDRLYGFDEQPA